jgi:probable DNA metabolism protein
MFNWSNLIYHYDGSFEGLLCCVFESYDKKEIPNEIFPIYESQLTLFPVKEIITDSEKANRVLVSIPKKMGASALEFVQLSFLTCLAKKELYIVLFLRMGYSHGPAVMNMLSDDVVNILYKAVKHLNNESHLLKGFIRFSIINNALFAEIEPKNFVLPLLTKHFCERYPEEHFLIYDKAHSMALMYKHYKSSIISIDSIELSQLDDDEKQFQDLWKLYYDTVEIEGRLNEKCRRSHMPKRYWKYLTEFKAK